MKKALRITLFSLLGLIFLAVAFLCAVTWYLTPSRLSEIIDREMSDYFNADVRVENPRFTFWSSFPHFTLETDSVIIISRNLDSLPKAELDSLPGNPKLLASASSLRGGINILKLLKGSYIMRNLEVSDLAVNIVEVNDSLNNYDIVPVSAEPMKNVPFFTTDLLTLKTPKGITVYFAQSDTHAQIGLDSVVMRRQKTDTSYLLGLKGDIYARTGDLTILNNMPLALDGNVDLRFKPFGLKFSNFHIDLRSMKSSLNMNVDLAGDMKINKLDYNISVANLMKLLDAMPWLPLGNMKSLTADLAVEISATLDRPYTFSSGELPWVTVSFNVPADHLDYQASDGNVIPLDYGNISAGLKFVGDNPKESTIFLEPFMLRGEGTEVTLSGSMSDILASPKIQFLFNGKSDLSTLSGRFPELKKWEPKGNMTFKGTASGSLLSLDSKGLEQGLQNLEFVAEADLDEMHCKVKDYDFVAGKLHIDAKSDPSYHASSDITKIPVAISASADDTKLLTQNGKPAFTAPGFKADVALHPAAKQGKFTASMDAAGVHCDIDGYNFTADKFHLDAAPASSSRSDGASGMPMALKASAGNARLITPSGSLTYSAPAIKAAMNIDLSGNKGKGGNALNLSAEDFTIGFSATDRITLHNASASFGTLPARKYLPNAETAPASHYLAVKAKSGVLHTGLNDYDNPLADIDIYYSPDSIAVNSLGISCYSSYAKVSGTVVNLHEFLDSGMKAPLKARLNIDCDTINVNQIAHTYYRNSASKPDASSAVSDTIPIRIPQNIDAVIALSAKESVYTNLHLYNLNGGLTVKDGVASVRDFNVSADFGHAVLGLTYDTSDLQNMSLQAHADLEDINVVEFFDNFHTLLLMMPQMSNLKGMVSLGMDCRLLLYPDMYINMPSLQADINLKGWDLTVHQNHFIHRLAHKLLIRGDKDLHIDNMNVTARVRDNLLELYPFNFDVQNYKLRALGTNNFNGNLYYHIDVMKSPIPFKFGVDIEGLFHDPKIRFGRAGYDMKKGEAITLDNEVATHMNLVKEVKYYAKEFVRKAAESKIN